MRFMGLVAIDGGGNDLNSFYTREMTFSEAADWYIHGVEYVSGMAKFYPGLVEVRIAMYNAAEVNRIDVEPIATKVFRPGQ